MIAGVLGGALAGCGGSSGHASATPTTPRPTPTTAAVPTTTAPTTTVPPAPTTTTLVGLALGAGGTTLVPPQAPTAKPASDACQQLVDPGFYGECVTVGAPSGTITALTEVQQVQQPGASQQERDLVYKRVGASWQLALRRVTTSTSTTSLADLWESDVNRDGDPKAVFVTPAPNSQFGNELDVVEASGTVTLYRQLHGGFATIASGGGLDTFVPAATSGYDEAVIRYSQGSWRIASVTQVSQAQAQAESSQPFSDPQGSQATSS